MTHEQIEILMLDSAVDSQKLCVARMKRRMIQAEDEWAASDDILKDMQARLQSMREAMMKERK
jgi:hypothetical protein